MTIDSLGHNVSEYTRCATCGKVWLRGGVPLCPHNNSELALRCGKCKHTLPATEFYKSQPRRCKACHQAANSASRHSSANAERRKQRDRERWARYRERNRDKVLKRQRDYYQRKKPLLNAKVAFLHWRKAHGRKNAPLIAALRSVPSKFNDAKRMMFEERIEQAAERVAQQQRRADATR